MHPVRRRLWSLATGELVSIVVLPWVAYGLIGLPLSPANVLGTALALFILLQGAVYWLLKLRRPADPAGMRVYAVLRWLNPVLLALALPVLVVALVDGTVRRGRRRPRVLGARGPGTGQLLPHPAHVRHRRGPPTPARVRAAARPPGA